MKYLLTDPVQIDMVVPQVSMASSVLSFGTKQGREVTAVLHSACLLNPFPSLGRGECFKND